MHSHFREVVWPERTERKPNSKQMLLPTEALRLLTCSSLPVHMAIETQQTAHTADPEGEHPLIYTVYIFIVLVNTGCNIQLQRDFK